METLGLFILIGLLALSIPFWIIALTIVLYVERQIKIN